MGIVYWVFCYLGTLTFFREVGIAVYWPATGIAVIGIYLLGFYASAGIFLSSVLINFFVYSDLYTDNIDLIMSVLAIAAANTFSAILGSRCMTVRVLRNNRSFFRLDSVFTFYLFVAFIPSLITSLTGATVTYFSGITATFFFKAHSWFLADLVGVIIIVPLIIAWLESPIIRINKGKIIEFLIIIIILSVSGYLIFTGFFENSLYNFLIAYFTLPVYFWLSLRFDSKAILTLQFVSLTYISYLAIYNGNLNLSTIVDQPYVFLQGFTILLSLSVLLFHSIMRERQEVILSLHKSEQEMKDVLTHLPLGVGILNHDAIPEFLNSEFQRKTGLTIQDFQNIPEIRKRSGYAENPVVLLKEVWNDFIHKEPEMPEGEKDISVILKNHEAKDFSVNINPLKDRYLMVMSDVTQRKQLLERIREDERRLASLIRNLQGMVYQCRLDRNWTMEFVSEGSFVLTGYLPSDLLYNSRIAYVSIIKEEFRDYVWTTIEQAVKRGEPYSLQYKIITRSGDIKWVGENGNGIYNSDGICRNLEGFIYDITDKIESLEALQKGEERYRSLFENMPVSLWEDDYSELKKIIDILPPEQKQNLSETLKSNRNLYKQLISSIRIADMNRASLELYGVQEKEKLVGNPGLIFASGDSEIFISVLTSLYSGYSSLEERIMEVKINRKKRALSVRWFIMPGYESSLSRILVTITDITELKKAEKEIRLLNQSLERKVLKRTGELNLANQELEAFSYSVSHDLKAPLRAVRGFSGLLMEEYGNSLPEGAKHYLRNILKNSENMTNLITSLLQFSRLGRKSLNYSKVDTNRLVNAICDDLFSLKKSEMIEFRINPLPEVIADESLLTQVFVNLLSNAVKFSRKGVPNIIEISCLSGSEFHEFCISDQGIGFEQKFADKIFKVFQRLHTSEEYEGSGVGLSIVQKIVHKHKGSIHVKSEPDKGTRFYFLIPVEIDSE